MIEARAETAAKCKVLALGLLLASLAAACLLLASEPADGRPLLGNSFTVNSTGDQPDAALANSTCDVDLAATGNQCTLRAAIQEANDTPNATFEGNTVNDTIRFNIGGTGVKTINSSSGMPLITQPVTIDGYTQPGTSKNTLAKGTNAVLLVELTGNGGANTGLDIRSADTVVRGLVINRYLIGISLDGRTGGTTGNEVEGNFIGTDATGTITDPDGTPNSGDELGNSQKGISIMNGASNNTIGGSTPAERNLISGNGLTGVSIQGNSTSGNKVEGNLIGTKKDGSSPLGTTLIGVSILNSPGNTVGGTIAGAANTIAFTRGEGVSISGSTSTGNRILRNSIFSNARLGIELELGANNLQSSPIITSAKTSQTANTVKGTLDSTPGGTFTIQFFSNPPSTKDEGKKFVGEKTLTDTDSDGVINFVFRPGAKIQAGLFVTATATDGAAGDTSEFSAPKKVLAA